MSNKAFIPFALAMVGAITVAIVHGFKPDSTPITVDLPDGNQVLASEIYCENSHFVVGVGDQNIIIPAGYRLNRDRDNHANFIHVDN